MAPRQGPDQARRRRVANAISRKWKIERQSKRPRGLVNMGNNCYRHGALQPLLHLPRFVNWIKKHNRGNHWPCHANDPNRVLPSDPLTLQLLEDEIGKLKKKKGRKKDDEEDLEYRGCTPCLLKRLMIDYWGDIDIGGQPTFVPNPFPHQHKAMFPLHTLAERWYCVDPPGHDDTVELLATKAEQEIVTRVARLSYMTAQQDSDEFLLMIFDGIQNSYDPRTIHGAARQAEYDSLFHVRTREVHTCDGCDATRSDNVNEMLGIRIIPDANIMDGTVENALSRFKGKKEKYGNVKVDKKTGDPIMVVNVVKNTNPISIPDTVDLTAHMDIPTTIQNPYPVRYKLVSATYHSGADFNAGHYAAGVTGPALPFRAERAQFFCNDAAITNLPPTDAHPNAITENPMQGDFNATTLYYERIMPASIPMKRS
ncbi:hypothetical protein AA0112_g4292 [Alternaria arborescens]|nr:hypothetical protein AA0112_g4292 [Alternaria arborescens]